MQVYVPTNPRGAELLPPGIVVAKTDLYLRRLWGEPNEVCALSNIYFLNIIYMSFKIVKQQFLAGFEEEAKVSCDIYSWV